MIYIFRNKSSNGARELAEAVDGARIKYLETLQRRVKPTDKVVMWGEYVPTIRGAVLNNVPLRNKFEDAVLLKQKGVATVEVTKLRPAARQVPPPVDPLIAIWETATDQAEAFAALDPTRGQVAEAGVRELLESLGRVAQAMRVPAPVAPPPQPNGEWIGRKYNHVGGNDILTPTAAPDYFSRKETLVKEFRIHSFRGKSIRAGVKIERDDLPAGQKPHAWVRSWDGGWKISYADGAVKNVHRDLAHAAVAALGLDFGAVDIGQKQDGNLIVLEVNRAPGVEAGTPIKYAEAIQRWIQETRNAAIAAA